MNWSVVLITRNIIKVTENDGFKSVVHDRFKHIVLLNDGYKWEFLKFTLQEQF